jgi:hypothetical protein
MHKLPELAPKQSVSTGMAGRAMTGDCHVRFCELLSLRIVSQKYENAFILTNFFASKVKELCIKYGY